MTETDPADSPIRPYLAGISAQWDRLCRPGTWWTGAERFAMAAATRLPAGDRNLPAQPDSAQHVFRAVEMVQCEAPYITRDHVETWRAAGIHPLAYVELVNVVATTIAADTFMFGIGVDPRPLPDPQPGSPTCAVDTRADDNPSGPADLPAFAPTVGPAYATNALSAVPAEHEAARQLQDCLYLPVEVLPDMTTARDLPRAAIELVAARTAFLNQSAFALFTHASMLRASARAAGRSIALRAVGDGSAEPGIEGGRALLALTDALVLRDRDELAVAAVAALDQWGEAGVLRAIGVVANFEMQCRHYDALGIPVPPLAASLASELGVQHSPMR